LQGQRVARPSSTEIESLLKIALKVKRLTMSDIAKLENVAPTSVSAVVRGNVRSRRLEHALASATGFAPHELWPDRYERKSNAKAA
jgi:Ner family transcriptional regulator